MPAPHFPPSVSRRRMLLSAERATESLSRHGRTRVALGFPNSYEIGMSNLGFQWVYRLLNREEDIACDRFFADEDADRRGPRTLETVSYTHLRAHETRHDLVCRLLLEKKKKT